MIHEQGQTTDAAARLEDVTVTRQDHDAFPLRAAARLAASGLPVFPCVPGGKSPLSSHGFKDATTSVKQIGAWLKRWPNANVAVATGGNGVDVLDVDSHSTRSGFAALEQARRAGLTDGWALIVRTPSGGLHLYYPARPERPQRSWSVGEAHIDFRGTGGYVLVPPSTVRQPDGQERAYQIIAVGRDPRPVDGEALSTLLRPRRMVPARTSVLPHGRGEYREQRIAAWMATRPEGSRNGSLFWAACRFADQEIPEQKAQTLLLDAAMEAGLTSTEAASTINSAYRRPIPSSLPKPHGPGLLL
jgi:hypothetical protein